jgi:hypothetical protein
MALPLSKTLDEIRRAVFIRTGMATAGSVPSRILLMVDEMIRSSHVELFTMFDWCRLLTRMSQNLVVGQKQYDLPASVVSLGTITRVVITKSDGRVYDLNQNPQTVVQNNYGHNPDGTIPNGQPKWYRVIEGVLEITPPPDELYTAITLEVIPGPSEMVANDDRATVDPEALIQRSTIKILDHTQTRDTRLLQQIHSTYLMQLRGKQRTAMSFSIASDDVGGPGYWYLASRYPNTRPYTNDWNPW